MRIAVFVGLSLFAVSALAANGTQDKVGVLIKQYDSDMADLHKLQATQADLVKQKAAIDVTGADLAKRQADLNKQADAHNAAVDAQKKSLQGTKKDCGSSNSASAQQASDCATSVDALNNKTTSLNNETLPMQTEQTSINLSYSQYNQTANDWNVQEQQNMTGINTLYGSMNDWLDDADALIGGQGLADEIALNHLEKSCPKHSLPANGSITVDQLMRFSADDQKCLKAVEAMRHPAHPGN